MAIKLRTLVKHPSRVDGDTGIDVTKESGVITVALDLGAFAATASIADPQRATVLLVTPGLTEEDADVVERMAADDFLSLALNFDAELAAIAGLTSAADRLPYFTGAGTAALADFTAFGRSLVDDANAGAALATLGVSAFAQTVLDDTTAAAALTTLGVSAFAQTMLDDTNAGTARATLGLVIGADVQAQNAELSALAGLTSAADKVPYFTGSGAAALADLTSFGRSLIDDANASAARTTLGLIIGTNVQAQDAELAALAGLTSAADKLPYFTGAGTAALADFTSFGRSLVDDANASVARTTLGLAIGADVQAFNARLADIAGATYAQGNVLYHNGSNLVVLAPGSSGQFLKTQGASANPVWSNIPGGGDLLAANNLSDVVNAATAFGNIKQAATAGATGVVKRQRMAIVRDEKTSGSNGGTFTSGADRTRDLNSEIDPDGIVTVGSNQFTLTAGTYLIAWEAPAYIVAQHQSFLYNVTDTIEVSRGRQAYAASANDAHTTSSGTCIVTIASPKVFEIRHRCQTTRANNGFGFPGGFGTEIYTNVTITSYDQ